MVADEMPRVKNVEITLSRPESPNWVSVLPAGPPVTVGSWSGGSVGEDRTNEVSYCGKLRLLQY